METPGHGPASFEGSPLGEHLTERLLEQRTLVVHEALSEALVARLAERLALLSAQPGGPVTVLLALWDAQAAPGLALHDAFRSARVRAVATGRVSGAGVAAFCGAPERYALPGARFRLEEPSGAARGPSLAADAEEIADQRRRVIRLLAEATGQPPERIERDLHDGVTFDAEEATHYGLVQRVVQSAREME